MNTSPALFFRTLGGVVFGRGISRGGTHKDFAERIKIREKRKEQLLEMREKKKDQIVHKDPLVAQAYAELRAEKELGRPVQFEKPKKAKYEYAKKGKDRFITG